MYPVSGVTDVTDNRLKGYKLLDTVILCIRPYYNVLLLSVCMNISRLKYVLTWPLCCSD